MLYFKIIELYKNGFYCVILGYLLVILHYKKEKGTEI